MKGSESFATHMTSVSFLFYILSAVLLSSSILVVSARNTVHSVLFLILAFLNAAGLFILAQAEFLAMILVIVYVGAVAVLFLFVVMMLNGTTDKLPCLPRRFLFIGSLVGMIFVSELILMAITWKTSPEALELFSSPQAELSNTQALGQLLYTQYVLVFQAAGLILFIAMIGAIVLTLRHREEVRKQKVGDQLSRKAKESIRLVEISHAR